MDEGDRTDDPMRKFGALWVFRLDELFYKDTLILISLIYIETPQNTAT